MLLESSTATWLRSFCCPSVQLGKFLKSDTLCQWVDPIFPRSIFEVVASKSMCPGQFYELKPIRRSCAAYGWCFSLEFTFFNSNAFRTVFEKVRKWRFGSECSEEFGRCFSLLFSTLGQTLAEKPMCKISSQLSRQNSIFTTPQKHENRLSRE